MKTTVPFTSFTFPKLFFLTAVCSLSISAFSQTKINDGTVGGSSLPDNSAILELESSNKGFLLSRVSLTNTTTWGLAGATPIAGMLVYNTNASITSSTTSYPVITGGIGCYYWNGSGWVAVKMDIPKPIADTTYWTVKGNAGTNRSANFLGTTDNHPLVLKINNIHSGYIDSSGGTGTTSFGLNSIATNLTASYTGLDNTAIGSQALQNITSGSWNIAVGSYALQANTSGGTNTAMGQYALGSNQTGWNNTAMGQSALGANLASNNTAVGQAALTANTWGTNNVAIGQSALQTNTTGSSNVAIGQDAMSANVTGIGNIGIGLSVLKNNTASHNLAIGLNAMTATTSGGNNTVVGYGALQNNITGTDNTILGYNAGNVLNGGGSNNILIGSGAEATSATASNTINIGNTVYATNINAAARKVGINNNAPTSTMHVTGSLALPITTTTGNLTVDDTHYTILITGAHTITLPAAASYAGRIYVLVNQTAAARTVSTYRTISAAGTATTIAATTSITVQSDGTNWYRIH